MKMPKGIVAYDSNFGNTEKIARALAHGLEGKGVEVDCLKIDEIDVGDLTEYDLIAIGGPTHMIRTSKPMREFLEKLRNVDLGGLKGKKVDIVMPRRSALVEGREGPLHDGMEEMFTQIGAEIAVSLQ
jgi:flavodoxin